MKRLEQILIIAGLSATCGCLATEQHVSDLQRQMNVLNGTINTLQKNQAELNSKMDTLSKNLSAHSENLKDFDEQLSKLSVKLDDLQSALDTRFSALGKTITKQQEQQTAEMLPSKIYSDSHALLMKRNYERAAQGFALYLDKFPSGELAESSYYYLGDAYAAQNKFNDAALSYATLLQKFKTSQYTAAARIKYAQSILKLPGDHNEEALKYFKSVTEDYPDTEQAKIAGDYLRKLTPKPAQKNSSGKKTQNKQHPAKK